MIPELYINKAHLEAEGEASDTVFSALETPRNLDYNFDTILNNAGATRVQCSPVSPVPRRPVQAVLGLADNDVWLCSLMVYTITVTPYRVAFVEVDDPPWIAADLTIDGLFFMDVVVSFFSPYFDAEENLIVNRKRITLHYLFSWFFLDVLSCFPFELIIAEQSWGSLMRAGKLQRLYRILKFSKCESPRITRIFKAYKHRGKIVSLLSFCGRINVGCERVSYLIIVSMAVIHVIGCMWYFVDHLESPTVDSWVVKYQQIDSPNFDVYVSACYWTITTLATVGYGDIVPVSTLERIYCSCVMFVGVVFYSYTIGTVTGLLGDFDRRQTKLNGKLSALQDISKKYRLSHKFFKQLKTALEQDQYRVRKEREDVMNSLPRKLAARLTLIMHKNLLSNNKFFRHRSLKFVQSVLPLLRPMKIAAEEVVFRVGEVCDESNPHSVYFIGRGRLAYYIDELHVHVVYEEMKDKDYFGEVEFFFAEQRETNVKANTSCEVLSLVREDLFNRLFPEFEDLKIEMIVEAAATRERLKKLRIQAEEKRREQFKRAKGLPLSLNFNEIERLNEMQPSLSRELIFEEEKAQEMNDRETAKEPILVAERFSASPEDAKHPVEAESNQVSKQQSETPALELSVPRRIRRSVTSPQSPDSKLDPEIPHFRSTKLTELKTYLNSHTLALLEKDTVKDSNDVKESLHRIEARLTRIEVILEGLIGSRNALD